MIRLISLEFRKLLAKPRSYISPSLVLLLVVLVFWALKKEGAQVLDYVFQALEDNFLVQGEILTGAFATYLVLNTLWIHIPVLLVIVTGDLLGSELESGTVRLILTRPIGRARFFLAKTFTGFFFALGLVAFLFLVTYFPAQLLFGKGDLLVLMEGLQVLPEEIIGVRFLGAFTFAALGMGTFSILSVCLAVFTRKSLSAILIALGFLILSTLVQTLGPSLFPGWENFLLTYHLSQWQLFFQASINWSKLLFSTAWLLGFMGVCIWVSLEKFKRLDLTE